MIETITAGDSAYVAGADERAPLVDRTLYTLLESAISAGQCSYWDLKAATVRENLEPARPAANARLFGRSGDILVPAVQSTPANLRHPAFYVDSATGKPCLLFGWGGAAPNALNNVLNGAMVRQSRLVNGQEQNDRPIITPTTGRTAWAKVRMPAKLTTVNGIAFGDSVSGGYYPGGVLWGNNAGSAAFMNWGIHQGGGALLMRNNDGAGDGDSGSVDLRDGAVHTFILTDNRQTGTMRAFVDPASAASAATLTVSNNRTDVATTAGADRVVMGATIAAGGAISARFGGFVFAWGIVNAPLGEDATSRQALIDYLATC